MARGWESKSVAAQIEAAEDRGTSGKALTSKQVLLLQEKETLNLSKVRVLRDLENSRNPRYAEILKKALGELERRLAKLGSA
ncbi:MAG: hypothetical protein WD696_14705 [Bryobacteraceae bacterium]